MKLRLFNLITATILLLIIQIPATANPDPLVAISSPTVKQLTEGKTYPVEWNSDEISTVTITAEGELTSIPSDPRGHFSEPIAEDVDATLGSVSWTVPFLDTINFTIDIKGYDENGQLIAEDSKPYIFRPSVLSNRSADGIYIDLGHLDRQRLYVLKDNILVRAYLTSGSRTSNFLPKPMDSSQPFDPIGVFRVMEKVPMYWSKQYSVWMTSAMRFWKGHFIHGTYPSEYPYLGTPASSGCIRLDRSNALDLYNITPVGTRVEVFGNND